MVVLTSAWPIHAWTWVMLATLIATLAEGVAQIVEAQLAQSSGVADCNVGRCNAEPRRCAVGVAGLAERRPGSPPAALRPRACEGSRVEGGLYPSRLGRGASRAG